MVTTCWVNNYRLLKQWHEIPFGNIDCAIHQICRNCKNPAINAYYRTAVKCCPNDCKNSSRLCYYFGDEPNTSRRIAAFTQNYNNEYNNQLKFMTRGGVCTRKFLNYFLQSPAYDSSNCTTAYSFDPLEKYRRKTYLPFMENYGYCLCPLSERWIGRRKEDAYPAAAGGCLQLSRQHLQQKRNIGSSRLPLSTNKWIKQLCRLYGDVVTPPECKGVWYDVGQFHKQYNPVRSNNEKNKDRSIQCCKCKVN